MNRARATAAVLLGLFTLLIGTLILRTGVTYDESAYAALGPIYLQGRPGLLVREYPPLPSYLRGLALMPLSPSLPSAPAGREKVALNPNDYGQLFLFTNRASPTALIRAARLPTLAIAMLLALVVWLWANALGGAAMAATALLFLTFEPNILAHASLATTDLFVVTFSCTALWAWASFLRVGKTSAAWAAGAAVGAAIASKATGLILAPALVLALVWSRGWQFKKKDAMGLLHACLAAAAVTAAFYVPSGLDGFMGMLAFRSGEIGRFSPSYFFGSPYTSAHPLYIPGMLLIKTTLPLLVLGLIGARRFSKERPEDFKAAVAALAVLIAAALLRRSPLGVRHLLLVYPLLSLAAGWTAVDLWNRAPRRRALIAGALCWHILASLAVFPHPLAYFNELAGGPSNGRNLLGNTNLDWGQDLPELKGFIRDNPGGLILSYFGKDCARAYGLGIQEAFSTPGLCPGSSALLPVEIEREWLAVSATKWQGYYESGTPAWSWLKSRTPYAVLGYSLMVYDITHDIDAHDELAAMYLRAGSPEPAARERARSKLLRDAQRR